MKFTGERVIPGEGDTDLLNEHLARYRFARQFASGKTVLDAACGSGYGAAILGETAKKVCGVDIAGEAVGYARQHYESQKVFFTQADCLTLPFASAQFSLVVAFEIIEHLTDPEAFLRELGRVLQPSGVLLLSTPNRLYYTEERGEVNPFHHREFVFPELDQLLQPLFPHRSILFENHVACLSITGGDNEKNHPSPPSPDSLLYRDRPATGAGELAPEPKEKTSHYFVAVCSRKPLRPIRPLLYLPTTGNVLREREVHIRSLREELQDALEHLRQAQQQERRLEESLAERTRWAEELNQQVSQKNAFIVQLSEQLQERTRWAQQRERELEELLQERTRWGQQLDQQIAAKDAFIAQLQQQLEERTRWAQDLDQRLVEQDARIQQVQAEHDSKVQWALSLEQELGQARAALERLQKEFEERTAWALQLDAELLERRAELAERHDDLRLLYNSLWYRLGKNLRFRPVTRSDPGAPPAGPK